MSVSKWAYNPEVCDGEPCVGECDICGKIDVALARGDRIIEQAIVLRAIDKFMVKQMFGEEEQ